MSIKKLELCLFREFVLPVELRVLSSNYLYEKLNNQTIHDAVEALQPFDIITDSESLTELHRVHMKYGPIQGWDTSEVTNMAGLFCNFTDFNEDISEWDVSNVTTMVMMFDGAESFNQNLNSWYALS